LERFNERKSIIASINVCWPKQNSGPAGALWEVALFCLGIFDQVFAQLKSWMKKN
jgi:hypothetical protein